MRTYEEIALAIRTANSRDDVPSLQALADELTALDTPRAIAAAENVRGTILRLQDDLQGSRSSHERALAIAESINDADSVHAALAGIGSVYFLSGDLERAFEFYHRALDRHAVQEDLAMMAPILHNLGFVTEARGEYREAIRYGRQAMAIYEELGDQIGMARALMSLGNAYCPLGDHATAIELYERALEIFEAEGFVPGLTNCLINVGVVYQHIGSHQRALEYYSRSLELCERMGYRKNESVLLNNIADAFKETDGYAQALEHSQRSLEIAEEIGDADSAEFAVSSMIDTLIYMNDLERASELLERMSTMRLHDPRLRAGYHVYRSRLFTTRGDLDAAHESLQIALQIVQEAEAQAHIAQVHLYIRDLAQKRNDFATYIEHNNEYLRITEEINGKEATQRLAMMEAHRAMEAERREREKERALLYGALPESIATRMLRGEDVTGDHYDCASVLFLDIVGFTQISDRIPPRHVVHLLEQIFKALDEVAKRHGVTKVKTIGDSYMAVSYDSPHHVALCAVDMMATLDRLEITMPPEMGDTDWTKTIGDIKVRIGIHCGPVTAGVIGTERLQYDVWGDTVNVASRMESTGDPGRIQVSEAFASALGSRLRGNDGEGRRGDDELRTAHRPPLTDKDSLTPDSLTLQERGVIDVKGKGPMTTYWLTA